MKNLILAVALLFGVLAAAEVRAAPCATYPFTLTNGQTADANQVMANFNAILNCANTNLATAGTNSNITALTGLMTPLSVGQGGTGATTLSGIQTAIGGPFLVIANNLSDVASPTTALANLGAAPLASPALTGVPTAPTAAGGTSTTQIATTAFVANAIVSQGYAVFQQQKPSGTASGEAISATTWTHRNLDTSVVNTISGASLSANQMVLPAGTYTISTLATGEDTSTSGQFEIRLRNITASTTTLVGNSAFVTNTINGTASLNGVFVLSGTTTLEIDQFQSAAGTGGIAATTGELEVYVSVALQKIG